jgi:hypothetical protein
MKRLALSFAIAFVLMGAIMNSVEILRKQWPAVPALMERSDQ